ncbi:MAG: hypothetical protein KF744_09220 [Taibaiella sp.]|nr:hypothetical protein [Taibaiella sp.]
MAENVFMPGLNRVERIQALLDNAHTVRDGETYFLKLTEEEKSAKREMIVDNLIKVDAAEEEFAKKKEEHKAIVKPLLADTRKLQAEVRSGQKEQRGKLYDLHDVVEGRVYTYNEDGVEVDNRRMRPDEKSGQSKLFIPTGGFKSKTGTGGE